MGIDIGGTTVKIGQFDLNGELLYKWEVRTDKVDHGKNIARDIYLSIKERISDISEIQGYGFGVPGPVREDVAKVCVNLGWVNYDLKNAFKAFVENDNIHIGNDANVAALGEAFYGAAKGFSNMAMITLGTGVGGGFVLGGNIFDGASGNAGEIGHLAIPNSYNFQCNCGKKGCLETIASATGIKNIYNELKDKTQEPSILDNYIEPSAKLIVDCAKKGDKLAERIVEEVADAIGYAAHVFGVTTNPSVIVIGGGVSKAGDYLIDKIKKYYDSYIFAPAKNTKILEAKLGNEAGIYGCAKLVMNYDSFVY
jgi:glucokinase